MHRFSLLLINSVGFAHCVHLMLFLGNPCCTFDFYRDYQRLHILYTVYAYVILIALCINRGLCLGKQPGQWIHLTSQCYLDPDSQKLIVLHMSELKTTCLFQPSCNVIFFSWDNINAHQSKLIKSWNSSIVKIAHIKTQWLCFDLVLWKKSGSHHLLTLPGSRMNVCHVQYNIKNSYNTV